MCVLGFSGGYLQTLLHFRSLLELGPAELVSVGSVK